MSDVPSELQGFTVVNLGSGGDAAFPLPRWAGPGSTIVELDAADSPGVSDSAFERRVTLTEVVAGSEGTGTFTTRAFVSVSGLLEPKPELVAKYGVQREYVVVDRARVTTRTLAALLAQQGVTHVDLLKTDLEGLDLDVLMSCGGLLDDALCIRCELRIEPFYEGEPKLHDALAALDERGFDLQSMITETWQPAAPHRERLVVRHDGQTVWGDCILLKRLAPDDVAGHARQVVLLSGLAQRSVAGWILGTIAERVPSRWHELLTPLVTPPPSVSRPRRVLRAARHRARELRAARQRRSSASG